MKIAQSMARVMGVKILFVPMGLSDDLPDADWGQTLEERKRRWLPENKRYIDVSYLGKKRPADGPCPHLFKSLVVNPAGKVFPCCYLTDERNAFGDLTKESLNDIWDNDKYRFSRSLFTGQKYYGPPVRSICSECRNYEKFGEKKNKRGKAST